MVDTSTQDLTQRYYTPYGELLSSSGTWPGQRGFTGGITDATTSLTDLGAREYNPAIPAFISPDPLLNPDTPTDLDPYSYAYNNPANDDDPTGQTVNTYQACGTDDPYCGGGTYDNVKWAPYGSWSDFAGGLINAGYQLFTGALTLGALATGGPQAARAVNMTLPSRIPLGNPDSSLYGAGILAPMLIPGADEADATVLTADSAGMLAIGSAPERLAIEAAPERLALPPGGQATTVFRADTREPETVFSEGFRAKGGNMDLWEHVNRNPPNSGFVSTTQSWSSAQDFAEEIGADYIYKARGSGFDVNATFGSDSPYYWENEISVPRLIPPSDIEGAWGPGGWSVNPKFAP